MADLAPLTALQRAAPLAGFDRAGLSLTVEQGLGIAKLRIYGTESEVSFYSMVGATPPANCEQTDVAGLNIAWLAPG